ncbi:MAG: beta-ketoacyl-ACP synthase II [Candidatus Zixiibacteriota bacterium]|nr:MAG: beta-ketoacyl-ACP synthase II [candidate division Zixibacteria bacterium]
MSRRVVVTGIGLVTPLGNSIGEFWKNLISGNSGVALIDRFDATGLPTRIAAQVKDFDPNAYINKKAARRMDLSQQYAIVAACKTVEDSGLDLESIDRERVGVIIGSGIGGLKTFEDQVSIIIKQGPLKVSPFFIPMMIADMAAGLVSIQFGFKGPNYATVSACASSSNAVADSFALIQRGAADIIVCGGTEASITLTGMAGFCMARAMSTRNDEPEKASRPFDKQRDGFVMGEGAAIFILEELSHALARGAEIYAEIIGMGLSADAYHVTAPVPDGNGAARSMKAALDDAGISPDDIDYINSHGTATDLGDIAETAAVKTIFGERAYKIPVNSTKSIIGHLLGAAGSVELAATVLQMQKKKIHPTINLDFPDPKCDLDYVTDGARDLDINFALTNSFGFGGHNISLVLKKYQNTE